MNLDIAGDCNFVFLQDFQCREAPHLMVEYICVIAFEFLEIEMNIFEI